MAELHLRVVTNLAAVVTIDEDGQVEVLISKGVVPTEGELGERRTDVGLVLFVDDTIAVDILVLQVAHISSVRGIVPRRVGAPVSLSVGIVLNGVVLLQGVDRRVQDVVEVLIDAHHLIAVEVVETLAGHGAGHDIVPLTHTEQGGRTSKALQFVLVEGELQVAVPREVLRLNGNGVQGDFETSVLDVAIVAPRSSQGRRGVTAGTHDGGEVERHEHVLRHLLIPVEHEADTAVDEAEVETNVPLLLCLPLDVEVLQVGRTIAHAEAGVHDRHG